MKSTLTKSLDAAKILPCERLPQLLAIAESGGETAFFLPYNGGTTCPKKQLRQPLPAQTKSRLR